MESNLSGPFYKIPKSTQLPKGLNIVYDGRDKVPGGHNIGHYTIYPIEEMTIDKCNELYLSVVEKEASGRVPKKRK